MHERKNISIFKRIKIQSEPIILLVKAFEEEIGHARTHSIARKALRNWTRQFFEKVRKNFSGNPIDLIEMGISMFADGGAREYEILNRTDELIDFNITRCEYANLYKEIGEADLGYLLICELDYAMAERLGSDIEFKRTQTIMKGASHCDFKYRLKV